MWRLVAAFSTIDGLSIGWNTCMDGKRISSTTPIACMAVQLSAYLKGKWMLHSPGGNVCVVQCLQAAMSSTEERVHANAAAERAALASEYEARIAVLLAEVERLRGELGQRTIAMAAEMDR